MSYQNLAENEVRKYIEFMEKETGESFSEFYEKHAENGFLGTLFSCGCVFIIRKKPDGSGFEISRPTSGCPGKKVIANA